MLTNIDLQNWLKQFPDDLVIFVLEERKDVTGCLTWMTFTEAEIGNNVEYVLQYMTKTPIICFGNN